MALWSLTNPPTLRVSESKTKRQSVTKTGSISDAALEVILVGSSMIFVKIKEALNNREVVNCLNEGN